MGRLGGEDNLLRQLGAQGAACREALQKGGSGVDLETPALEDALRGEKEHRKLRSKRTPLPPSVPGNRNKSRVTGPLGAGQGFVEGIHGLETRAGTAVNADPGDQRGGTVNASQDVRT